MDWTDDGIVLRARKHGESAAIVTLLTREHGRHAGLVRGGGGSRARGIYQPGNLVQARWSARLSEHLGTYSCELSRALAADLLRARLPLLALSAATSMADTTLPEREPHGTVFEGLAALLMALDRPGWEAAYVRWELALLADLGFGLDLSACAATGTEDDLVYVSPRTGRAVSGDAGAPWRDRLLVLPGFLLIDEGTDADTAMEDVAAGLSLTGHFLTHHVFGPDGRELPVARARLVEGLVGEQATVS